MTPKQIERRARWAVHNAVVRGELERPDACEQCGHVGRSTRDIHGHHDDYSKPLDVRWLCSSCHKRHHLALRHANGTYRYAGGPPKKRRAA